MVQIAPFSPRFYKNWLAGGSFLIFFMIVLGGYTRLSGSGLSIVEWDLIGGILPPLSESGWQALFSLYQKTPEYQLTNSWFTLSEFQAIFWAEYIHRLLGRFIGMWFLVPLPFFYGIYHKTNSFLSLYFFRKSLLFSLLLGGQGTLGWYMVKSGLLHEPAVSPYRLVAHLGLGILIYLLVLREFFFLSPPWQVFSSLTSLPARSRSFLVWGLGTLLSLTILLGALVAGHKAGLIYNTFPLMNEHILPPEAWFLNPWWKNLVANPTMVQFEHRLVALMTLTMAIGSCLYMKKKGGTWGLAPLTSIVFLQGCLGLMTLLYQVPVSLGVLHQGTALVVASLFLRMLVSSPHPKDPFSNSARRTGSTTRE